MNRKYIIYIIVGIIAISVYIYLYLFFIPEKLKLEYELMEIENINVTEESQSIPDYIEDETDTESDFDFKVAYAYRDTARNPFSDYKVKKNDTIAEDVEIETEDENQEIEDEDEEKSENDKNDSDQSENETESLSPDIVKSNLPFHLKGIIGNEKKRIAILESDEESLFIKTGDSFLGYQIQEIRDDGIVVKYKNIKFVLKVGGDYN